MARETTTPVTFRANAKLLAWIDQRAKQGGITRGEAVKRMIDPDAAPAKAIAAAIPGVTVASKLPKRTGDCPKCGKKLIAWGPEHHRCTDCGQNWPSKRG